MRGFVILAFFLVPLTSFASISINEVMYDLEGTDTDREWLEVKNIGSESINLSNYKFYENSSNHGLVIYSGEEVVSPGDFAVIVDSPTVFLEDWPSFSGNLFDSSWSSFSNTGESFSIKNEDGDIVDDFVYVPENGANGDGNSLQLVDGGFISASPTPGEENQTSYVENSDTPSSAETSDDSEDILNQTVSTFGISERVVAGERIKFEPKLYDNDGILMFKELFLWSLGDGTAREDQHRKDFYHTYESPGTYVIYVEVYENGRMKDDPDHVFRQSIQVLAASVSLGLTDGGVSVKNKSVYELDLGDWDLILGDVKFRIPKNTIILPGKEIIFSESVLNVENIVSVSLQNESDSVVASINQTVKEKIRPKTKTIYVPVESTQEPVDKIVEQVIVESEVQIASAASAIPDKKGSSWVWIYIILIIGALSGTGYVYFNTKEEDPEDGSEADEYTFVE